MVTSNKGISFVVPAYNEENAIASTLSTLEDTLEKLGLPFEIILVNDGSSDGTLAEAAKFESVKVLSHPTNIGYGNALKTGITAARYDWVGMVDADGSYPIQDIPKLVAEMDKGFDMVVGARDNISQLDKPIKRMFRYVYKKSINIMTGSRIDDPNSGFRIFDKRVALEFFDFLCGAFSFTTGLSVMAQEKPFFIKFVPIEYMDRTGKSKVHHGRDSLRALQLIIQGVTYYNPMKFFLFLALLLVALVGFPAMLLALFSMHTLSAYYMIFGCTVALLLGVGVLADVVRVSSAKNAKRAPSVSEGVSTKFEV